MATICLPVFEKFKGNFFLFGPLAAERRTAADEEFSTPCDKIVFFDPAKFGRARSIGGRDIRGQRKLEFPDTRAHARYCCPKTLSTESYN